MTTGPVRYKLFVVVEDPTFALPVDQGGLSNYDSAARENTNAGFDLVTAETWMGGDVHLLDLGVRAMMVRADTGEPVHFWLAPRSSIYKTGYMMANSLGVIDASYRGVLKAPVVRVGAEWTGFQRGDRHFQICAPDLGWIETVERVSALPETVRGDGGFGSTGN
jgi:dUTP pyrophosphatase